MPRRLGSVLGAVKTPNQLAERLESEFRVQSSPRDQDACATTLDATDSSVFHNIIVFDSSELFLTNVMIIIRKRIYSLCYPVTTNSPFSTCFPLLLTMATPTSLKRNANHLSTSATDTTKKSKTNTSITSFFGVPKPAGSDSKRGLSSSSSSFNKEKWVASLTPEQKDLLRLEIDTLDESWLAQLKDEVVSPEFLSLKRFLKQEKEAGVKIFPPENEIYSWCISLFTYPQA